MSEFEEKKAAWIKSLSERLAKEGTPPHRVDFAIQCVLAEVQQYVEPWDWGSDGMRAASTETAIAAAKAKQPTVFTRDPSTLEAFELAVAKHEKDFGFANPDWRISEWRKLQKMSPDQLREIVGPDWTPPTRTEPAPASSTSPPPNKTAFRDLPRREQEREIEDRTGINRHTVTPTKMSEMIAKVTEFEERSNSKLSDAEQRFLKERAAGAHRGPVHDIAEARLKAKGAA